MDPVRKERRAYGVRLVRGPIVDPHAHPLTCADLDGLSVLVERLQGPLAADLFCGAGGLSLGLEQAGFHVVLGVDSDAAALRTWRSLHAGLPMQVDLGQPGVVDAVVTALRRLNVRLVAGGPPCQPFSRAGRSKIRSLVRSGARAPGDHRRDLWQAFLDVIAGAQPEAVLFENVPDMALGDDLLILRTMVEELEALGYDVHTRLLDAWRHGVPQFRQRFLLVAIRGGREFSWPAESREVVTVDNAIGDLPEVEGGWRPDAAVEGWLPYGGARTSFQRRAREGCGGEEADRVRDHITRPVRPDDRAAFAQMDSTTSYAQLDPELRRYRSDIFDDKYKRLDGNQPSRSITAHIARDGYWYIHPSQDRTLTVREAARLQTFPDHVRFAGPPSMAFRQIGNAVPPRLAEEVGREVLSTLARPRRSVVTTQVLSEAVADWFEGTGPLLVPWLRARTVWGVVQGELLLSRANRSVVRSVWPLLEKLEQPVDSVERSAELRTVGRWVNRPDRVERMLETARWLGEHPAAMTSRPGLGGAPHVSAALAALAATVVQLEGEAPVLVSDGLLRVAARVSGRPVDRTNRLSDGRVELARLVGAGARANQTQAGLVELAASLCRPDRPACSSCPLRPWCAHGSALPDDGQLL